MATQLVGVRPAKLTGYPYTFLVALPVVLKAGSNWRLTVMVRLLPDILIEDPLPLSVHCEFEMLEFAPGVR
jgi:hypothetical protein